MGKIVTWPDRRPAARVGFAGVENSLLNQTLAAQRKVKEAALQGHHVPLS